MKFADFDRKNAGIGYIPQCILLFFTEYHNCIGIAGDSRQLLEDSEFEKIQKQLSKKLIKIQNLLLTSLNLRLRERDV